MPIPNKLEKIAAERGKPLEELILELIEEYGSIHWAAASLHVSPNSLKYWLKKYGYSVEQRLVTKVVKENIEEVTV